MARLIVDLGHRVQTATDVRSAVELAAREPFDLMISDRRLPDGNGYDLMRMLREKHELKGIALSGYGTEDAIRKSQEAGFAEHLTKPVDAEALEAAINRVAGARSATGRGRRWR
jgi:CheY-like chemotaxis protein